MDRVFAADLDRHPGDRVRLLGWLHRMRRLSKVSFLILRDVSGLAQVVLNSDDAPQDLVEESVIEIKGRSCPTQMRPEV